MNLEESSLGPGCTYLLRIEVVLMHKSQDSGRKGSFIEIGFIQIRSRTACPQS